MPLLIFQIIYYFILVIAFVAGIFIVYHIIKYSYSKIAMLLMLLIFCGMFAVLISANYALFSNISADDIESLLNF